MVRCGIDMLSEYCELLTFRMPLIQWQSPRVLS